MEESLLYKLYGYGLCKEKPTPKIAKFKVTGYRHFLKVPGQSGHMFDDVRIAGRGLWNL